MKALSIRQPWAWAIVHAGKRCENREWRHAPSYRGALLIHAAKGCTQAEYHGAWQAMTGAGLLRGLAAPSAPRCPPLAGMSRGGIVGRARLADVVWTTLSGHRWRASADRTCMLCGGSGNDSAPACSKRDPWAIPGALGLILADVEPLPFVPLKGMLGLFDVDEALVR